MRDRKKRNIIIGSLCCLLIIMGIGYAVLSQTLNITGTANMRGTWDIKITDISEASRTGRADPGTPTISSSGVSASFEANLWMPGDSITYNITVNNNGNIDAALKELVPSVENGVQQVKFSNNAVQGKVLRQNESYTFQVSVVFDENATEIPQDSKTNPPKYTISLTFVQYTGNSLYTPTNETTDNSCFVINTEGEITGYDYNCGTVVTVPAEIDGIQVKSIARNAFSDADSFNVWSYSKEESATLTKTYYIFKDQNARSLFLEINGMTQEELDAMAESDNTYNYLKGDSALNGVDLGTLDGKYFIYRSANGEIAIDEAGNIPITELDLSHADNLESIDFDYAPNLKRLNLNTASAITFKSFSRKGYGPLTYALGESTVGELEELIINADVFNSTKEVQVSSSSTMPVFSYTHIKKLIILDGKESHVLKETNTDEYGLFLTSGPGIETVIIDDGITELASTSLGGQKIKNITLPGTLTTIGNDTFDYNQLTSLTIPTSVKTIGKSAFLNNQLTSLTIPASVETLGNYAFSGNQLTSLTIPASVETIGTSAFSANQLTTINFESNSKLKTIGSYAFGNNQLTNTGLGKLPSSLTSLDTTAFNSNTNLTQITLTSPKDLTGWPNGGTVDGKTVTYER